MSFVQTLLPGKQKRKLASMFRFSPIYSWYKLLRVSLEKATYIWFFMLLQKMYLRRLLLVEQKLTIINGSNYLNYQVYQTRIII